MHTEKAVKSSTAYFHFTNPGSAKEFKLDEAFPPFTPQATTNATRPMYYEVAMSQAATSFNSEYMLTLYEVEEIDRKIEDLLQQKHELENNKLKKMDEKKEQFFKMLL